MGSILDTLKERADREYYWAIEKSSLYIQQFGYSKEYLKIETEYRGIFTVYSMTGEEIHKLINLPSYELSKIPYTEEEYLVIVDVRVITRIDDVRTIAPANDLGIDHLLFYLSGEIEGRVLELYLPMQNNLLRSLKPITDANPFRVIKKIDLKHTFVTSNGDMYINDFLEFTLPDRKGESWSGVIVLCKTDMEGEVAFEVIDRYYNVIAKDCDFDEVENLLINYLNSMSIIYNEVLG